jgi:UDP-N-acetylglucosamine--N-acetylmuramyl-(pentapeptide) pyrophosphoryl-undecaprenol N-acetylglucosamine transferase
MENSQKKKLKIILATGGTGGHIFPAESIAEILSEQGHDLYLFTDKRFDDNYKGTLAEIKIYRLPAATIRSGIKGKICSAITILRALFAANKAMKQVKPDIVIGFGGYPSFAPVFAATHQGIPTIIHEQNSILGKVNRMFARDVNYIATSFPDISLLDTKHTDKVRLVGNPVRKAIRAIAGDEYQIPDNKINILVTGGSQGAQALSSVTPQAIAKLPDEIKSKLFICQQCRKDDNIGEIKQIYADADVEAIVSPFFVDLPERLKAANLVIARSGAGTVSELTVAGRPSILIPYPHAADNHQYKNAESICENEAGWLINQDDYIVDIVVDKLRELLSNPQKLSDAAANAKKLGVADAANNLAELVINCANKEG